MADHATTEGVVTVLLDYVARIIPILVGVTIAWVKLADKVDTVRKDVRQLQDDLISTKNKFDDHTKDTSPHKNCPVHSSVLDNINHTVNKIDKRLDVLDRRLFALASGVQVQNENGIDND